MNSYTILIVDDDALVRDLIGTLLQSDESSLFYAENGLDALAQAARILPDIILLDVMMPDMDGFEVCAKLRADPVLAEVPVIMITAMNDRESHLRGLKVGADDFLTKPVDRLELVTRVQSIGRLNRYRKLVIERQRFSEMLELKNRQLRELTQSLIELQESERRFIAAELHDDLGQILTGLKLMLEMATKQSGEPLQATLESAKNIIADLSGRVRNLSLDLRPAMLDDFGLFAAMEWLFGRFNQQSKLNVEHNFSFLDERRFPKAIETAAFRIIQEALTNVVRYADVNEAEVRIETRDEHLYIKIRDRGLGFNVEQHSSAAYQSGGLSGMRERASWLGGSVDIRSKPGAGTTVLAIFDLRGSDPHG